MTGNIFLTCTSLHFLFSFFGCFSCPGHKFFAILRSTLLQHGYSSLGFLHHTQNALQHLHSQKHHKKSIRLSTNHGSFSLQLNEKKYKYRFHVSPVINVARNFGIAKRIMGTRFPFTLS